MRITTITGQKIKTVKEKKIFLVFREVKKKGHCWNKMCYFLSDNNSSTKTGSREPWQQQVLAVNPGTWGLGRTITLPCWTLALIQKQFSLFKNHTADNQHSLKGENGHVSVSVLRSKCHGRFLFLPSPVLPRLLSYASEVHIRLRRMTQKLSRLPLLVVEMVASHTLKNIKVHGRSRGEWREDKEDMSSYQKACSSKTHKNEWTPSCNFTSRDKESTFITLQVKESDFILSLNQQTSESQHFLQHMINCYSAIEKTQHIFTHSTTPPGRA